MTRGIDSTLDTQLQEDNLRPLLFIHLEVEPNKYMYYYSGAGVFEYGGNGYLGLGAFISYNPAEEVLDYSQQAFTLGLSGIPGFVGTSLLQENAKGRNVEVLLGAMNDNGVLTGAPIKLSIGKIESVVGTYDSDKADIVATCQSTFSVLFSQNVNYYSEASQTATYDADDTSMNFLALDQDKVIYWRGI